MKCPSIELAKDQKIADQRGAKANAPLAKYRSEGRQGVP
jgi:hypothetical protein